MLWEDLGDDRGSDGTVGPAVCEAHNKEHGNFYDGSSLVPIRGESGSQAGHNQQGQRLNRESSQKETPSTKSVHSKGIDQHNEQLEDRLNTIDGQGLGAGIPSETLIDEGGVHGQGSNTTALRMTMSVYF